MRNTENFKLAFATEDVVANNDIALWLEQLFVC